MTVHSFTYLDRELKKVEQIVSPVYLVGGCVRDTLMGKVPHDFDYASPIEPDDIEKHVRGFGRRPYLSGKRFGTIGFKLDGKLIEITTFRSEAYATSSRHPRVQFETDIEKDLSRRDFTINAMAYRTKLFDPFNGREDLSNKILRSVGNPYERIQEDPLRMLRAARFASQLGFTVDSAYLSAGKDLCTRIYTISKERWVSELDKLLCGPFTLEGIYSLMHMHLLSTMFPEAVCLETNVEINAVRLARALGKTEARESVRWAVVFAHLSEGYFSSGIVVDTDKQKDFAQELVKKYGPYLRFSKAKAFEILSVLNASWDFYIPQKR